MKAYIKIYIAFAIILMAGCSDKIEQIVIEQPSMFTIAAGDGDAFGIALKAGDKIGINGKAYPILSNKTVGMYDVPAMEKYFIYYPADMDVSNNMWTYTLPAVQNYSAGVVDRRANPVYGVADNGSLKEGDVRLDAVVGGLKVAIPANADFASVTSITLAARSESDIFAGDIAVDIESGKVSWGEHQTNVLNMASGINITEGGEVIFAIPPLTFQDAIDVTMYSLKGEATATLDLSGQSIESGQVLSAALEDVQWISMTDYYGKANAVIVEPGQTSVTVDCTPYYTTSLQYAYENIPQTNPQKYPRSAKMLWNDVSTDFVGDVTLATDGKSFTAALNGQPGNALIAIYDKEDPDAEGANILWSFHIWVTDINEIQLGTNGKGNTYTILDRNLGAVSNTPGDWRAIGMLYQWGRKDPFVSTGSVGQNSNAIMYNHIGTVSLPVVAGGSASGTIAYAIRNPTRFIRSSQTSSNTGSLPFRYAHDWLYYADDALWGNPEGYNFPAFATLAKSVYDPSPEGYMITPADTWLKSADGTDKDASVFADAVWDGTNLGYRLQHDEQEGWYALGGWRSRSNGSLSSANTNGYYWSSTVAGTINSNARFMTISSGGVTLNGVNSRANSCSVRCVKIVN